MEFGTIVHNITQSFFNQKKGKKIVPFRKKLKLLLERHEVSEEERELFSVGGEKITKGLILKLKELFDSGFKLIDTEVYIWNEFKALKGFHFKGFMDFLLNKDNKYYIIDLKTTTKSWPANRFKDQSILAQLRLYKHFYGRQKNIPLDDIYIYYLFGKRDIKKKPIELKEIPSGDEEIKEALGMLLETTYQVLAGKKESIKEIENKGTILHPDWYQSPCFFCDFNGTKHCP